GRQISDGRWLRVKLRFLEVRGVWHLRHSSLRQLSFSRRLPQLRLWLAQLPALRLPSLRLGLGRQRPWGTPVADSRMQHGLVQTQLGHQLLQLAVFFLELLHLPDLIDLQSYEVLLPPIHLLWQRTSRA